MVAAAYTFGDFRLHAGERRLSRADQVVHLEPKALDLLLYLVAHAGRLVPKKELVDAVWPNVVVTENSLTRCVHQVRTALGDNPDSPTYIETVTGSGYRFVASVVPGESTQSAVAHPSPRRPLVWVAVALVSIAMVVTIASVGFQPSKAPRIERIAVLPLVNLTDSADQQYLVDGIHEALITELSRIRQIDVISRTSVMRYATTDMTVPEIAKQLNVDAIVEGSVSRLGERLIVTTQLVAAEPERHLWAERYDRRDDDVLQIVTEAATAIASHIPEHASSETASAFAATRGVEAEAYDAYLLGRFHFSRRGPGGYQQAQQLYRSAIEIDPDFAPAYVGLAHTFGSATVFGMGKPAENMPRARQLGEQAVRLDPSLAEAHMILAGVSFYWDWDWAEAERIAEHALSLNPSSAHAWRLLAEIFSVTGRREDALMAVERARGLDPLPPTSQFKPSLILYLQRDYAQAHERARAALTYYPDFWQGHWLLCLSLSAMGRHDEAVPSCEASASHSRRTPMALGALGYVYARSGQTEDALAVATELEKLGERRYVGPANVAVIHGALGDRERAFAALERAYAERDQLLVHVDNYGFFDPLRSDERFHALKATVVAAR